MPVSHAMLQPDTTLQIVTPDQGMPASPLFLRVLAMKFFRKSMKLTSASRLLLTTASTLLSPAFQAEKIGKPVDTPTVAVHFPVRASHSLQVMSWLHS